MYFLINSIILALSLYLLLFCNYNLYIQNFNLFFVPLIIFVFLVHIIKAYRLYIALYGENIRLKDYIKTYCKVTPVSILFPLKLGEIYRIYCYGYLLKNYIKSTIIILLDRFMDTLALVTIIVFLFFLHHTHITVIINILVIFLVILSVLYYIYPGFYKFWKHYFLKANATKTSIYILTQFEKINNIYNEIKNIISGRGIILYCLSLIAWITELINLIILSKFLDKVSLFEKLSEYLSACLGIGKSPELFYFAYFSISLLLIMYIILKIVNLLEKGGK